MRACASTSLDPSRRARLRRVERARLLGLPDERLADLLRRRMEHAIEQGDRVLLAEVALTLQTPTPSVERRRDAARERVPS